MPFTMITAVYVAMLACIVLPMRFVLSKRQHYPQAHVNKFYAVIVGIHMVLCLSWLILAMIELQYSDQTCWDKITWQYVNYYAILLITLGPAVTLALGLSLFILCMPCIIQQLCELLRNERMQTQIGEIVVAGLANRKYNPE